MPASVEFSTKLFVCLSGERAEETRSRRCVHRAWHCSNSSWQSGQAREMAAIQVGPAQLELLKARGPKVLEVKAVLVLKDQREIRE
jgi:hypothetical protein